MFNWRRNLERHSTSKTLLVGINDFEFGRSCCIVHIIYILSNIVSTCIITLPVPPKKPTKITKT